LYHFFKSNKIIKKLFYSENSRDSKALFILPICIAALWVGKVSAHQPVRGAVVTRGAIVTTAPRSGAWVSFGGTRYIYDGGVYYRPHGKSYVVVTPPIGFRLRILPAGYTTFYVGGLPYYYYAGTYYITRDEDYIVVQPPVGALVESVPKGGKESVIDCNTFYEVDGIQYQAVLQDGAIWYKVIKAKG
jgi:hypothetical protein